MDEIITSDDLIIKNMKELIEDSSILVTGGSGTIGGEIVKRLLEFNPRTVRIFSNDENSLFQVGQNLDRKYQERVRYLLGDVKDYKRLVKATLNVDFVFHAAALKHVGMSEFNPFEAIKTNAVGTQNLIDACIENNVKKMILISTDKAANPLNVMGATKLLAEKLVSAAMLSKGSKPTTFASVRFGNVFGSRGSIYPIFRKQILSGKKVTITNPDMTRFLMTISDSVNLVFMAFLNSKGGEVFLPKMSSIKIDELTEIIINKVCKLYNLESGNVETKIINTRPGEKMHEQLLSGDEVNFSYIKDNYIIMQAPQYQIFYDYSNLEKLKIDGDYSSELSSILSVNDINSMIDEVEEYLS